MKVPGVAAVVGGITGGAVQMLQTGVNGVASAAGTMQTLAGPVVNSVSQSTARVLGTGSSSNGKPDGAAATVRWQSGRRVHLDLDPLLPFPRWHEHAAMVEEPVRKIPGVATAHVEGSLGRLVIELEDDVDSDAVLDRVRDVVASAAADLAAAGPEPEIRTAPFADPGNPLAILVPLTAAAFDAVAIGAAVTGWVVRLPAAPRTTRAAAALLNNQPRMIVSTRVATGPSGHRSRAQRVDSGGQRVDPSGRHSAVESGAASPADLRSRCPSPPLARPRAAAGLTRAAAGPGGADHLLSGRQIAGATA